MVANAGVSNIESAPSDFVSIKTCRIVDTRDINAPTGPDIGSVSKLGQGETVLIDIDETFNNVTCGDGGSADIPTSGVESVLLNVTAVNPSALSFLVLYPGNISTANRPIGSNVNFKSGDAPTANQVTVLLGSDNGGDNGLFKLYNHAGTVDVVIDINGYFLADGAS